MSSEFPERSRFTASLNPFTLPAARRQEIARDTFARFLDIKTAAAELRADPRLSADECTLMDEVVTMCDVALSDLMVYAEARDPDTLTDDHFAQVMLRVETADALEDNLALLRRDLF